MKFVYPHLLKFCEHFYSKLGIILTIILVFLLAIDIFISVAASIRQNERKHNIEPSNRLEYFLDKHYPDDRMNSIYNNKMYRYEKNS